MLAQQAVEGAPWWAVPVGVIAGALVSQLGALLIHRSQRKKDLEAWQRAVDHERSEADRDRALEVARDYLATTRKMTARFSEVRAGRLKKSDLKPELFDDLFPVLATIQLVFPEPVLHLAVDVGDRATELLAVAGDTTPTWNERAHRLNLAQVALINAMRTELGYEPVVRPTWIMQSEPR